jgi:hypothetical protein
MNTLYHKVAVTLACTALSCAFGANKEAKAATFTLRPHTQFVAYDIDFDEVGRGSYGGATYLPVGKDYQARQEFRSFYEFNIASLSLASNTVISSAIFEGSVNSIEREGHIVYSQLQILGYVGNGDPDASDFNQWNDAQQYELYMFRYIPTSALSSGSYFNFEMTEFVNNLISNREPFVGFGFRFYRDSYRDYGGFLTFDSLSNTPSLTITTVDVAEPVPEPTTIFGSAIGLCLGGWLKRRKSALPHKTTSQN